MFTSINEIDKQLNQNFAEFKKTNGFFIEAGANDGILQSNTYYFENQLNWKGILIEPTPKVCQLCKNNRSKDNIFINAALVADDYGPNEIVIEHTPQTHGLMTTVKGLRTTKHHLWKSGDLDSHQGIMVPAISLNKILEQNKGVLPPVIDFFSLDVEGYEVEVLKGLNFNNWHIEYILIEQQYNSKAISEIMEQNYILISKLSTHDYLWKRKKH